MQSVAACVLVLAVGATAIVPPFGFGFSASPWTDTSMCSPTDPPAACQLKKSQCSPVGTMFSPPGGPIKPITKCANATGIVLGSPFYMNIGMAFASGNVASIADMVSPDPNVTAVMRYCFVNATGFLNDDMTTLNRTAIAASASAAFKTPALGAAVVSAVATCPEPVNYQMADFITCLKTACMNNVALSPSMGGAGPSMGGPGPFMGASPFMGGPKPFMGGPGPFMGGAGPFMGGPGPSMGGPAPVMGAPAPVMGGPAPAMQGPILVAMGPAPVMEGPASAKKVPATKKAKATMGPSAMGPSPMGPSAMA